MNAQNVVGFCAPSTQLRPNENGPDPVVPSSTFSDGQSLFKKPLPRLGRMQNEPEDLSLSSTERSTRTRFWSFVDEKKRCGEVVLACSSCLLVFSDPLIYRIHVGTHAWGRSFQCMACGVVCHDRVAFQRHLISARHG